jgi:hypothetical protein
MYPSLDDLLSRQCEMQILKDLLLLGDTDGSATSTSGLGVLSSDSEHPVVSKTTVASDLKLTMNHLSWT